MKNFTSLLCKLNGIQGKFSSHILLYHSTYARTPGNLKEGIHNVSPDVLYQQIKWLMKHFDVVEVDRLFNPNNDNTGKVAITFDDAYQSVFEEGLPVIYSLKVPCTIFINGCTLNNRIFWRDKIRFFINNQLVNDFLKFCKSRGALNGINVNNFYRATKSPMINSEVVDKMCDNFIEDQQIKIDELNYCLNDIKSLVRHPLISYGNHTYNHYVLSSLSEKEQESEIGRNHELLLKAGVKRSRVFSIPFGADRDFNSTTINFIKKYEYIGFLYSGFAVNINLCGRKQIYKNCLYRERYMVPSEFDSFQKTIAKIFLKGIFKACKPLHL